MLQIGISYVSHSVLFDHGANQTALTLAEIFESLGYSVTFLSSSAESLAYPVKSNSKSIYDAKGFDWLFDIDGLLSPEVRSTVAKRTIVFLRTFLQFTEMDRVVYIESPYVSRTMKGVYEVWCWDLLNPVESLPSIQTLFPCPIRRVPFLWSTAVADHISQKKVAKSDGAFIVHIAENCINNTNSCILPLVAIRELHLNKVISTEYRVHGADGIQENRFFKENILNNIEIDKLPVTFVKNEPFSDWIGCQPAESYGSILLSHSRFTPLRLSLLHALWAGIPLIHNSPILRDLHPVLKDLFYVGNSIRGISASITTFLSHSERWYDAVPDIKAVITNTFGIEAKRAEWSVLCSSLGPPKAIVGTLDQSACPPMYTEPSTNVIIAFSDMWPGFQPDSNVIVDALRHEYPHYTFSGILYDTDVFTQLLIVGPFGTAWKSASTIPKVFFTGENWPISEDPAFSLYLSSAYKEDATHMRLPTWMTFIDWYSNATELPADSSANPIRFPVALAMRPHPVSFSDRTHFCGFVVSNPTCVFRNEAFKMIHGYKHVDSGGNLYNNIGGLLSLKYPGGGSGDLSKYHFFSDRRFSISFENARSPGYITEKVLHAKMAGCVPLYWGDSNTADFVPQSFVNVSSVTDPAVLVKVIQKLEAHPEMCAKMASTPILDEEKKQKALATLSGISKRLMELILPQKPSWDKVFIVNLDSRADRWKSLLEAEPSLSSAERISAVDGRKLSLTPEIYQLFQHNNFKWKKSIMGCLLSHFSIWKQILHEKGDSFLILEDDVRFEPGWREQWNRAHVPKDADIVYLGGILPPNRAGLPTVLQKINECCYSILPNRLFSPTPLPVFHFCTYAYAITRSGVEKIMKYILHSDKKLFTPCDHFLMHPSLGLTKYVLQPLLARCFQDDDSTYCTSQFNDLQRTDTFDSDICNNNECFQNEEVEIFQKRSITLYHFSNETFDLYEREWLEDMLQVTIHCQPILTEFSENAWFLVQRPHLDAFQTLFLSFEKQNRPFHVLHLSDEFGADSLSFYGLSMCKTVIRNYPRALPRHPRLFVLPLGYHYRATTIKPWEERELMWSFHGTDWFDRSKQLEPLRMVEPYSCRFQPDWNHPTMTPKEEYLSILGNSKFCPILRGNHAETFRLYEALEAGALPITTITDKGYLGWIEEHMGLSSLYPWTQPLLALQQGQSESIRQAVGERWASWKKAIRITCAALL
jgi:GR25 family glycosyltransferase involved in LPS biosynthesis